MKNPSILRTGKLAALGVTRIAGLSRLLMRSSWRRARLAILCYHWTSLDDEHDWSPLCLTPSRLRRRMELIREAGCNVLPLDESVRRLQEGTLPPRSVALTFDDGTYDFYREAYPILRSFGFPVTVYLTTYYSAFNRPVYDPMCSYLLWKGCGQALHWPEVFGSREAIPLSRANLPFTAGRMRQYAAQQRLSGAEKDALLSRLAERLQIDYETILRRRIMHIMNEAEVRELAGRGVDFQLHTHRHRVSRDKLLFAREISQNREYVARLRGSEPAHFCYPSGVHRAEFPAWLREWNIRSATTCDFGIASSESNPMLLPRFTDFNDTTEAEFGGWLSGIGTFLPRRAVPEAPGQFLEEICPADSGSAKGAATD
jgi:peptidoglycan/xylan/chitin deacetylase (PgdA/CDA1 family)